MSKGIQRNVVISSGHNNFHMLFTAAEMERRERLVSLICGGYPTPNEQVILDSWPFNKSRKFSRFRNRLETIPASKIFQSRASEVLEAASSSLGKIGFNADHVRESALKIYGKKAHLALRKAAKQGAEIYHYRAGYGQSSVEIAKSLGMKTICDHSIVHPALLNVLIEKNGSFPDKPPQRQGGLWGAIQDDIDQADHVIVNSDFVADTFRFMNFDLSRISIVYQGVENKFLSCLPRDRSYTSNGPLRVLFAGGILPRKGVDEISAVMKSFTGEIVHLTLAGMLPPQSRIRYADLLAMPNVRYLGMLSQANLAEEMSKADVFLFPSRAEGSARVLFEAMAAGCSVITTRNSGSVLEDKSGGYLVSTRDIDEIKESIRKLIDNPSLRSTMGQANRKKILEGHTQSDYGRAVERVYDS